MRDTSRCSSGSIQFTREGIVSRVVARPAGTGAVGLAGRRVPSYRYHGTSLQQVNSISALCNPLAIAYYLRSFESYVARRLIKARLRNLLSVAEWRPLRR